MALPRATHPKAMVTPSSLATRDIEVHVTELQVVGPAVTPAIPVARKEGEDLPAEERLAIRRELERARGALLRCRRLGTSLRDYIRLSFEAQGLAGEYGPRPAANVPGLRHTLDARV